MYESRYKCRKGQRIKVPSCVVNSSKTLRASRLNVGLDETNSLRVLKPANILDNNNLNIGVQNTEAAHKGFEA